MDTNSSKIEVIMTSFHALALSPEHVPLATRKAIEAATEEYVDMNMGYVAGEEQLSTAAISQQVASITLAPELM